jgi:hypothetical protein
LILIIFCFADQIDEINKQPEESIKRLIKLMDDDPECQGDKQNILFIDEVQLYGSNFNSDFLTMTLKINLDVILIVRPTYHKIPSLTDGNTYIHCLKTRHRNPFFIGILSEHYYRYFQSKGVYLVNFNKEMSNVLDKETLPDGECPLWIHVGHHVETMDLLDFIASKIDKNKSVTVLQGSSQKTKNWIKKRDHQNWKCKDMFTYYGCEDEIIVILDTLTMDSSANEKITRATSRLIIVTHQSLKIR